MLSHSRLQLLRTPRFLALFVVVFLVITLQVFLVGRDQAASAEPKLDVIENDDLKAIIATARQFSQSAIKAPFKSQFWETGRRSRIIREWIGYIDQIPENSPERASLLEVIEDASKTLFPFIQLSPDSASNTRMMDLINFSQKGTRGIVICAGGSDQVIRFAAHLIASLREVVGCQLPIQIAYAGDDDLPVKHRNFLSSLDRTNNISFLNVWSVFDDRLLRLKDSGWAIKPFAAIASHFEQVIVLDADSVFVQNPEHLFRQQAFVNTGAYLFHDRLLWQHAFQDRHEWWKDQIKEPSDAMNKSLVWTQDYAEECDSGVVVLDKSRLEVFMGLLHTAWQNTYDVREEVTYKITYGDKESWWLGLELAGATYEFEEHYGSMLGWESTHQEGDGEVTTRICSFVIAHVDDENKLIWYNGSLLKNKSLNPNEYEVPEAWMTDGKWEKGAAKKDMSCMLGAEVRKLTTQEHEILWRNIQEAMRADQILKEVNI